MLCLAGSAVALILRSARAVPAGPAARDDVPEQLLRWAVGLLSAQRAEWGQAMLGELDYIDGWGPRWRFAAGCAGAALLLPPWGRTAAALWAMVLAAAGAARVYAAVAVRYRLGAGGWIFAAIVLVFLVGFTLAAATLLRRPGIALPGLLGGLVVALTWLALSGFTFSGVTAPMTAPRSRLIAQVALPALVGVAGVLWGGSAAAGRRIARLAAISGGLGLYLYADHRGRGARRRRAARGSGLHRHSPSATGSAAAVLKDLVLLPLVTATIAWATATATARLRPSLATSLVSIPVTATGPAGEPNPDPVTTPHEAGPAVRIRSWHGAAWLLLLWAGVVAAVFLAVVSGLRG